MDRTLVYPSQQPTDTLWLNAERNKVISLGWLAQGVLGTNTVADGLLCTATSPASMAVNIGAGAIYSQTPLDSVAYGSLGVDTVDQIIKQGVILATSSLTLTPPATSGQAINYLIEAELVEQDTNSTVLSYFNSATPTVPFTGPAGSGVAQPTLRQCTVALVAKAGVAATAGSQVAPTPDAGYVGLWVVTVANGATTITSANISQYSAAPFLSVKLPQLPAWVQGGTYGYAADTGTANALAVTLTPAPTTISAGFQIRLRKNSAASTGAMTISVNGAAAATLAYADGTPMSSTQIMPANFLADLTFDGTSWRFMNGLTSSAVGSLTASSGEGTAVTGGGSVALNLPGLSVQPVIAATDLLPFYSQADAHHRVQSWTQFLSNLTAAISASIAPGFSNIVTLTSSGTWTVPAGVTRCEVTVIGGGAGAALADGNFGGGGGGGGGASIKLLTGLVPGAVIPTTIGLGGAAGSAGGLTAFGSYLSATGGSPGSSRTGGVGGMGVGGTINMAGSAGGVSSGEGGVTSGASGVGGASFMAGASAAVPCDSNQAGVAGNPYGGGGSGGARLYPGGSGASGVIVIRY